MLAETIEVTCGLDVDFSIVSGRSTEAAAVESNVCQNLRLIARFDNVKSAGRSCLAGFGLGRWVIEHRHIQLAVREQGRSVAFFYSQFEAPENFAAIDID